MEHQVTTQLVYKMVCSFKQTLVKSPEPNENKEICVVYDSCHKTSHFEVIKDGTCVLVSTDVSEIVDTYNKLYSKTCSTCCWTPTSLSAGDVKDCPAWEPKKDV